MSLNEEALVSRPTLREAGAGRRFNVLGDQVTIVLEHDHTGGVFALITQSSPPGGGVEFLHTHSPQETFFVLAGEYEFYGTDEAGSKAVHRGKAGTTFHIPSNRPHGFKNVGSSDGLVLAILQPAGIMEPFFEELHAAGPGAPPAQVVAIMQKYGMKLLESPGDAPNRA